MDIVWVFLVALAVVIPLIVINSKKKSIKIDYVLNDDYVLSEKETVFWWLLSLERNQTLKYDKLACEICLEHSYYMLENRKKSHDGINERRRILFNNGALAYGENVGLNTNVDDLFKRFMESDSHRKTMLDEKYNAFGISIVESSNKALYCTLIMIKI